jgi:PAS domain S-box-containing protein
VSGLEDLAGGALEAAIVANTDHAVIVADAEGTIRFWNPAAEAMFGWPAAETIGRSLDVIVPEKLRERHWDGYHRVMATGETEYAGRTLAVPALRADGSRLSIEFTVTLLPDDDGSIAGIAAVVRDVTAQWEERRALMRRLAEAERALAERDG